MTTQKHPISAAMLDLGPMQTAADSAENHELLVTPEYTGFPIVLLPIWAMIAGIAAAMMIAPFVVFVIWPLQTLLVSFVITVLAIINNKLRQRRSRYH